MPAHTWPTRRDWGSQVSSAWVGEGDGQLNWCLLISSRGYGEDQNTLFSEMANKRMTGSGHRLQGGKSAANFIYVQAGLAFGGWGLSQETCGSPCVCPCACRRAVDGELTSQPPPPWNDITETPALEESTQGSWEQEPGTHGGVLATSPLPTGEVRGCWQGREPSRQSPMCIWVMSDLHPGLYVEGQVENTGCVPEGGLMFDGPQGKEWCVLLIKWKILCWDLHTATCCLGCKAEAFTGQNLSHAS